MENQDSDRTKKPNFKVTVNEVWCKKCGICIAFCPKGVFVADEFGLPLVKFPEKCIGCMLCVIRCPDLAIEVEKQQEDQEKTQDELKKDPGEQKI